MKEHKNVSRRWRTTAILLARSADRGGVDGDACSRSHRQRHPPPHKAKKRMTAISRGRRIQAGRTVRGTIGAEDRVGIGDEVSANASLPGLAPFALDDDHVTIDGTSEDTGKCTGSVANPTAAAGWVCIYPYYHRQRRFRGGIHLGRWRWRRRRQDGLSGFNLLGGGRHRRLPRDLGIQGAFERSGGEECHAVVRDGGGGC